VHNYGRYSTYGIISLMPSVKASSRYSTLRHTAQNIMMAISEIIGDITRYNGFNSYNTRNFIRGFRIARAKARRRGYSGGGSWQTCDSKPAPPPPIDKLYNSSFAPLKVL
jgi:hypothetical protein